MSTASWLTIIPTVDLRRDVGTWGSGLIQTIETTLVGGNEAVREAVRKALSCDSSISVLGTVGDPSDVASGVADERPDLVILLAHRGSGEAALDICRQMNALDSDARVLVLVADDCHTSALMFYELGARACLPDSAEPIQLRRAVREVARGSLIFPPGIAGEVRSRVMRPSRDSSLTDRENQILEQMGEGLRNREIARALGISTKTVETHVRHVLLKLGATSRTQAVVQAMRSGWF